jgi:hypothetical protein
LDAIEILESCHEEQNSNKTESPMPFSQQSVARVWKNKKLHEEKGDSKAG